MSVVTAGPARLLDPDAPRDVWLARRREGIGASEIAAVLGISPWESAFSLFWRKTNGWEVEVTPAMRAGLLLESAIADWWADEYDPHRSLPLCRAGLYASAQRPWQLATPDRLIYQACPACDGTGYAGGIGAGLGACVACLSHLRGTTGRPISLLECKWVAQSWDGWGDEGTDDIPVHYRAQALWQADVLDINTVHLAALGPGGFRAYLIHRDEKDLRIMREAGHRFMNDLAAGRAPDIDAHTATLTTLKRLHPDLRDDTADVPPDVAGGYLRAVTMRRKADALHQRYEIRLRHAMGDARKAACQGRRVATRVITDIAASTRTVAAHRRDYLLPPREPKP